MKLPLPQMLFSVFLFFSCIEARGISQPPDDGQRRNFAQTFAENSLVFVGQVTKLTASGYTLRKLHAFKGEVPVQLDFVQSDGGFRFTEGLTYLIFIKGKDREGRYFSPLLDETTPLEKAVYKLRWLLQYSSERTPPDFELTATEKAEDARNWSRRDLCYGEMAKDADPVRIKLCPGCDGGRRDKWCKKCKSEVNDKETGLPSVVAKRFNECLFSANACSDIRDLKLAKGCNERVAKALSDKFRIPWLSSH